MCTFSVQENENEHGRLQMNWLLTMKNNDFARTVTKMEKINGIHVIQEEKKISQTFVSAD
jgi:hypothetical protein